MTKKTRIRNLTTDQISEIIVKYTVKNKSKQDLANEYNIGINAISILLNKHGIENDTVQVNMRISDSLAKKLDYIRRNTSNRTDTARRILTTGIENIYKSFFSLLDIKFVTCNGNDVLYFTQFNPIGRKV